jgi:hypothetical protein
MVRSPFASMKMAFSCNYQALVLVIEVEELGRSSELVEKC